MITFQQPQALQRLGSYPSFGPILGSSYDPHSISCFVVDGEEKKVAYLKNALSDTFAKLSFPFIGTVMAIKMIWENGKALYQHLFVKNVPSEEVKKILRNLAKASVALIPFVGLSLTSYAFRQYPKQQKSAIESQSFTEKTIGVVVDGKIVAQEKVTETFLKSLFEDNQTHTSEETVLRLENKIITTLKDEKQQLNRDSKRHRYTVPQQIGQLFKMLKPSSDS